ncbi:hypothetical protein K3724_23085 (plasmid) [Leisingera sp. M658]|nr:hypothetical protein [Leisingera sp. M658]UWQ77416.1 hypothetical protein K3724_23085 [Leisingera sp. M658]
MDQDGVPVGPWTPDLLARAISQIRANPGGIEVRTVQYWFQENDRVPSADSIRWLARIFGCNDPVASGEWQAELSAANRRLKAKRKNEQREDTRYPQHAPANLPTPQSDIAPAPTASKPSRRFNLARKSEALFSNHSTLNLPASVWAGWVVLGFLTYIMGVHSVTYFPIDGLQKQVGFFWAPNWTLVELVILPLFLISVAGMLAFWKGERRLLVTLSGAELGEKDGWGRRVESFEFSHWAAFFICFVIVFIVQWSGIHMSALVNGDVGNLMMDWNLLAIVRPEVISVPEATVLSMLAFLYTAAICFLFLTGLVFMYTLAQDFFEICNEPDLHSNGVHQSKIGEIGSRLLCSIYRASLLGIWIATCIKLQAVYLLSDGKSIVDWLLGDVLFVLGVHDEAGGWLDQRALAHLTSFLLLFSTCAVFFFGFVQIYRVLEKALPSGAAGQLTKGHCVPRWMMLSIVGLLVANFFLIGQFSGFSILLIVGILTTIYSLFDPMFGRAQVNEMTTSKS